MARGTRRTERVRVCVVLVCGLFVVGKETGEEERKGSVNTRGKESRFSFLLIYTYIARGIGNSKEEEEEKKKEDR